MDFNLKQWRDQQVFESEEEQSAKLFLQTQQQQTALPLFMSTQSQPNKFTPHLSTFPRYCLSIAQWQELEVQAVIYKHIVAGLQIPQRLLHLLISSASSYYSYNWGKGEGMDSEPGRCRRTDGKKWRCSKDVVLNRKYCERHVHRGKNRSRKPVEFPPSTPSTAFAGGGGGQFSLSGSGASFDAFQLHQGSSELLSSSDKKAPLARQCSPQSNNGKSSSCSSNNNNKVLMHLFDDWPRSTANNDETNPTSSTSLSISSTGNPTTSDFLRLSTGNGNGNEEIERGLLSWNGIGWGENTVASMGIGGPLAEALRSSTHSSPTSVLH